MREVYNRDGIQLIEGDCKDYLPTLLDGCIDLVLSDPPFGHNNNDGDLIHAIEQAAPGRRNKGDFKERRKIDDGFERKDLTYEARPIANDGIDEANSLVKFIIRQSKRLLVKGGNLALCCSGGGGPGTIEYANWSIWMDKLLTFKQMIIWDKGPIGMGWHYRRSYEVVLLAHRKGGKYKWYDNSDKIENVLRPGAHGIKKLIPSAEQHPNAKPVELAQFFIRLHTKPGDTVLDPCGGAGWVAEACRLMNRKFIGVEIDPHWCEVMRRRVETVGRNKVGFGVEFKS